MGAFLLALGVIIFVLPLSNVVSLRGEDQEALLVMLSAAVGMLLVIIGLVILAVRRDSKREHSN